MSYNSFIIIELLVWHTICSILSLEGKLRLALILAEISIEFQDSAIIQYI